MRPQPLDSNANPQNINPKLNKLIVQLPILFSLTYGSDQ